MSESTISGVQIAIDTRKYRLRIHKNILHKMGDPILLQFLVNPTDKVIAIRGVQKRTPGDYSARISPSAHHGGESCEVYCQYFIQKLLTLCDGIILGRSYLLTGTLVLADGVAYFPISTIEAMPDG